MGRAWALALAPLLLVWLALPALLAPSGASLVAIWNSSETYAHGYAILPIALWLVWRQRRRLQAIPAAADPLALAAVLALSLLWLAGRVGSALVVEHYALVGLGIVAVWALLGRRLALALLFPLAYLLFMVPAGDSLIEPLIHFTADFTVGVVRLLGIPVYREGTFFVLPSGQWSVVEACSGIRYFLSSLVLGWLYAYLTYLTPWKRLAFGLAAVLVPILANGLRASLIVLLGHYSDMTIATGVDHLIYGWVWFGLVMLALFWVGNHWREDLTETSATPTEPVLPRPAWGMALGLVALVAAFPAYQSRLAHIPPSPSPLARLAAQAGWNPAAAPLSDWQPRWQGQDDLRLVTLEKAGRQVLLVAGWYGSQGQDRELISSNNVLVHESNPDWRNTLETNRTLDLGGQTLELRQAQLFKPQGEQRLLVWHWQHIAGQDGVSALGGKLHLTLGKLLGQGDAGAAVAIAAPYRDRPEEAEALLLEFLRDHRAHLHAVLDGQPGANP